MKGTAVNVQVDQPRFAHTGQAMRAMEAIAVAASCNEPTLLVGETGSGKTTLVQYVAREV